MGYGDNITAIACKSFIGMKGQAAYGENKATAVVGLLQKAVCNEHSMRRVFYVIYRRSTEGALPCILHKTRGFLMLCVLYHNDPLPTVYPYLQCNQNNITRKELYDYYYTLVTLTTGYKNLYTCNKAVITTVHVCKNNSFNQLHPDASRERKDHALH